MKLQGGSVFFGAFKRPLFFLAVFLFFIFVALPFSGARALEDGLVINEIMAGSEDDAKYEFIELYNNSDEAVDLAGYSLKKMTASGNESNLVSQGKMAGIISAQDFFVISHPDCATDTEADLVYSGSSYSIADDNTVVLYDNEENIADLVGYGEAGEYEIKAAPGPEKGKSIARKELGLDTDNNYEDFILLPLPAPGEFYGSTGTEAVCGNGLAESGEECDDGDTDKGDGCSSDCLIEDQLLPENPDRSIDNLEPDPEPEPEEGEFYRPGQLVINELVSDPADNDSEWVEIYNNLPQAVDLAGWTLEEGGGAKTTLSGVIPAHGFLAFDDLKGNLNNNGDIVYLRCPNGGLVDQVVYGDWNDSSAGNAPAADDPYSIARKIDGYNEFNSSLAFQLTTTPTKGRANIITRLPDESRTDNEIPEVDYQLSRDVIISEIMPNPAGSDSAEFIELYNRSDKGVDLSGWVLGDESQRRFTLAVSIPAKAYVVIERKDSRLALNNSSDSVNLYWPGSDILLDSVSYDRAQEDKSYVCFSEEEVLSDCVWTSRITPGEANIILRENRPPLAEFSCLEEAPMATPILFDSSDTTDPDGDGLSYRWDFGDGATNTLALPEHTYFIPGVYTPRLTVSDGEAESVYEREISILADREDMTPEDYRIVISEFVPNPAGADREGEWIEIHNQGGTRINLRGWQLDDGEAGSRPFSLQEDLWLDPGQHFLFDREETGLALNNSGDKVRLISNWEEVMDQVEYNCVTESASFARGRDGQWHWTGANTPGQSNSILPLAVEKKPGSRSAGRPLRYMLDTPLGHIRDFDKGDLVRTEGTVAVLPGVFGSQYFYITGAAGIQVYSYKKDFPHLSVGDRVQVSGEISEAYGEKRIKTSGASDIVVLGKSELPKAQPHECQELTENNIGELVSLTGELVERKGSSLFLDDGTDERLVYIKKGTGIAPSVYEEGERVEIAGIVSRTSSGLRILPRSIDDIECLEGVNEAGRILGESVEEEEWILPARDKRYEMLKYLLAIAGVVVIILGVVLVRLYWKSDST